MQTTFQKVLHFFLVKIMIGIAVIVGLVFLVESSRQLWPESDPITGEIIEVVIAMAASAIAVLGYLVLFRLYEKRPIGELSITASGKSGGLGFITGLLLQSLFVLVIFITGNYSIEKVNPASSLMAPLAAAMTAGFVAEILIVGVVFRLVEEKYGTVAALIVLSVLFAILHINAKGASVLSVLSTAAQAGFLLPSAYVLTRKLWLPIFLHFGWDFAEPGIFGGINPGNNVGHSLFISKISGSSLLTGGLTGPQNSLQALIICLLTGSLFLWLATRKNNFINPGWKKQITSYPD